MAIWNFLKAILHKDEDKLYVEFSLGGSRYIWPWDQFKEMEKATSAVVKSKWNYGKLQSLAESLQKGQIETSKVVEYLKIMQLSAIAARDTVSVERVQGSSVWF
ncbi:hypothetical protein PMG11_11168 [Penicillium brasilianum]|uniref:Uncharacterized protein n=1 Tax=Penicillium brasilianum TaxID=104259 RepID=A0A0F7U4L4_PENBI|nr:hypothetical protein PMG11_11168 [Penicillium brasilianum]